MRVMYYGMCNGLKEYSLDYELLFACPETTFVRIVSFGTTPII